VLVGILIFSWLNLLVLQGDGYVNTGCYNLNQDCPAGSEGFVQVSSKVLLGGSISPPSEADSDQYEIKLRVFKVFLSLHNPKTYIFLSLRVVQEPNSLEITF